MIKKITTAACLCICLFSKAQTINYKVSNVYHIQSGGGWDYIAANNGNLYVSHGVQVNVLNAATGDSVGIITNTPGVHGIAFDNERHLGFTSNGRNNKVTVFDLRTLAPVEEIAVGQNPDAIMYEPFTQTVITCNGRSNDLSVINPTTHTVTATIPVGGKPETAVSDSKGNLFVNIEDKNEIAVVDLKKQAVVARWSLSPAEGPTGLAYDRSTNRLFAGCEKLLVVVDAANGKIIDKIAIGNGCDGVAFDPKSKMIFTSNGEGTMSVVKAVSGNQYQFLGNVPTKRGARTITYDEQQGKVFLPTADFEPVAKQGERPKMVPGSFQVLVVQPGK